MKKTAVVLMFLFILVLSLSHNTMAFEKISGNINHSTLEVTVEFTGSGRRFDITTYLSNTGDEQVTINIWNFPGGGFKIYNEEEEMVYYVPDFVFPIEWNLTLDPGQTKDIFSEFWKGIDDSGNILPSGNYSVIGFVNAEGGDIFSEPINIFLEKTKNNYILKLVNHFQILKKLENFINFFLDFDLYNSLINPKFFDVLLINN